MVKVPLRILIVEDNDSDLELIIRELRKGNFELEYKHCQTEKSFTELLHAFNPDLILSDHNLPSFNSTDALRKARTFNPHIPFILVSGFIGEEEAVNMIVNKGVNDFILKGNLIRLNSSISREVQSYHLKSELHQKNDELRRLSMVASHTNNGVLITDKKGKIIWVNSAFEKLSGYSLNECSGKNPENFLRGKDTDEKTVLRISQNLQNLNPVKEELLNYRKNGTSYWVKLDIVPISDDQGGLNNFIEIHEDITEAKEYELLMVAINDIATSLLDTDSFSEICDTITKKLIHHFGFEDCVIYEADSDQKKLTQVAATGDKQSDEEKIKNPLILNFGEGIVGAVAESKKAEIVTDTAKDDRYIIDNEKRKSELAVPILLDHKVLGVIDSEHPEKNFYTDQHLLQFETIAGVIASKFRAAQENRLKRKAEEDLRKSEEQLSQITQNIDVAVHRYEISPDGKGKLTYVSPRSYNIYEIEPEKALSDDTLIWKQIHEDDREYVNTIFEEAIAKKSKNVFLLIFRINTPSGVKKWIEVNGTITYKKDGTIVSDTINKDITKRVESEQAIAKNEQLLSSLTNNIPGVIIRFVLDEEKNDSIEFISEGCEKLYELSSKDILNDKTKLWELVFPEDVNSILQQIYESAEHLTPFNYEYRIKTKSSIVKWLRASGSPRKKEDNSVTWDTVVLDITKEKEFENSLIEANKRLLEAQELAQIGDFSIDFITGETYISPTIFKIHDLEPTDDFDIEKGLSFFKEGFDRDRKKYVVERAIEKGTPYDEELRLITALGKEKWVRSKGQATLRNGKCIRLFGTLMDISEQVTLQNKLRENEFRLDAAVTGADLGVWDTDLTNGTFIVNDRWFEMFGFEREEIENPYSFFFEIVHPDDKEKIVNEINKLEQGGNEHFELIIRVKGKCGEYRTILDKGTALEYDSEGNVTRMIGTHLDITDQVNLQKELEDSEFRLETAVHGANLAVWDADIKEKKTLVNDRWYEMLGYKKNEIDDPFSFFFEIIHPDERKKVLNKFKKIENGELTLLEDIIKVKSKSGDYLVLLNKGMALSVDTDGKVERMIGTLLDITKQYNLQKELEASISEKTVLLSEIHHRVKNNLAIVSGLLDLQAFEIQDSTTKGILLNTGQRIKSIAGVHELLYEGENFSEIKLHPYIQKLIKNLNTTLLNEKNIQFNLSIDEDVVININQAVPIGLLLNELITNSFKYAFREVEKPKITFLMTQKDDSYSANYFDNGPGINPNEIKDPKSLGTTLINTLLQQLNADFEINSDTGFNLRFSFKEQKVGAHSNIRS